MEVPAIEAGVLSEIRVREGEVAPVGAVVGVIGNAGGVTGAPTKSAAGDPRLGRRGRAARRRQPLRRSRSRSSLIRSSRYARRSAISARRGLPAASRSRHWRGGSQAKPASISRVCAAPARTAASLHATSQIRPGRRGRAARRVGAWPDHRSGQGALRSRELHEMPLDGMRRTIAARLLQAKQTIPHFYLTADIEIDRLTQLREDANAAARRRTATAIRRSSSRSTIS